MLLLLMFLAMWPSLIFSLLAVPARSRSPRTSAAVVRSVANDKITTQPPSWKVLCDLDKPLAALERNAEAIMAGYFDSSEASYALEPGTTTRFSVTTTCFSVLALANKRPEARTICSKLLEAPWRVEDLLQTPLVLVALRRLDPNGESYATGASAAKAKHAIETLLNARPRRRLGRAQELSSYLQYWVVQALLGLVDFRSGETPPLHGLVSAGVPFEARPDQLGPKLVLALSRAHEVALDELCRQLAFYSAGDTVSFDVIRLAYSLLSYYSVASTLGGSFVAAPSTAACDDSSDVARPIPPPNLKLVRAALAAVFDEQREDGLWSPGQPIFLKSRRQYDVGNAFTFAPDMLASLLETLPADFFLSHIINLQRTTGWLTSRQLTATSAESCDDATGQCYGRTYRGWRSNHLSHQYDSQRPLGWSTAQALRCVVKGRTAVRALLSAHVLSQYGGTLPAAPSPSAWARLLDADLPPPANSLKATLESRVIAPLLGSSQSGDFVGPPCYSAVLFGPPGGAKTTIAEAVAARLGWGFVVIDTASFLAGGLDNVAVQIKNVFDKLLSLDKTVILFDEIEEFCLDRETPGIGMQSRMLTTAMLTQFNELRRARSCLFFVATNRLRAFDSAVVRPGRFDMLLFVGTPNRAARSAAFAGQLRAAGFENVAAVETFDCFLEEKWESGPGSGTMFMNYLEGAKFADDCLSVVRSGVELSAGVMQPLLDSGLAVMTTRGAAQTEYLESRGMTRTWRSF